MSDATNGSHQTGGSSAGECITILARDSEGATAEFNRLGLAAHGFVIAGQVLRHRFAFAGDDASQPFDGEPMFAATYIRAAQA